MTLVGLQRKILFSKVFKAYGCCQWRQGKNHCVWKWAGYTQGSVCSVVWLLTCLGSNVSSMLWRLRNRLLFFSWVAPHSEYFADKWVHHRVPLETSCLISLCFQWKHFPFIDVCSYWPCEVRRQSFFIKSVNQGYLIGSRNFWMVLANSSPKQGSDQPLWILLFQEGRGWDTITGSV